MYPPAHDPAAIAYQQWLQLQQQQQQQQPAPQYTSNVPPPPAYPLALPAGAQQPFAPQYMPLPAAPRAPQYMPAPPAFQPSPLPPASPRRPRQPRQPHSEPDGNELVSLSIVVLLSLLVGAALGAVGEHHRLSSAVEAGVVQ
jgi:hypothetical protein